MTHFISGIELNRRFYQDVLCPILVAEFPAMPHSAALIGYGSDVLGYDTPQSTDHEWGPRVLLFLEEAAYAAHAEALSAALRRQLAPTFLGYSTSFDMPDSAGVRRMALGVAGQIEHHVQIYTVRAFVQRELGIELDQLLEPADWLTFPEQKLLALTRGAVYYDGLGTLLPLRERFSYYPRDVWLYLLASQWMRLSQEEAFVGRCGDVGDDLGSQVIAARLSHDLMRLCFLQAREYAPYSKWFGTAFARLPLAPNLGPILQRALSASGWNEREEALAQAYIVAADAHNALSITAPLEPRISHFHERPYRVLHASRFAEVIANTIRDERVSRIIRAAGLIGGIDQYSGSTDLLVQSVLCRRLKLLFDGHDE